MHEMKFINACQAKCIYKYMNTKLKLLNCNANIYFNKKCLAENLTPKYALTKTKTNSHNRVRDLKATKNFQITRIKNEIKFWYTKKQHLNKSLYLLHLENATNWNNLWNLVYLNIDNMVQQKMKTKYDTLNNKIDKLKKDNRSNTIHNNTTQHTFFKRTINMTDIIFTDDELNLLDKGLKYNLHKKPKNWIKTLALEADTTIRILPEKNQPYFKQLVANNLQKLIKKEYGKSNKIHIQNEKIEWNTLKNIKQKLINSHSMIVKADKGNTLVILKKEDYIYKLDTFINNNNFTELSHDITNKMQQITRNFLNNCKNIVKYKDKSKLINMNPRAPHIYSTIKLHKQGQPIRPIVNWTNCPAYNIAKHLNTILINTLQLPNAFNVKNTSTLAHSLQHITINNNTQMCSFDIENMYTNIPTNELFNIIENIIAKNQNISHETKIEINNLLKLILEQNYFEHNGKWFKQNEGLAMGAPTSAILAEIFIQYLEHTTIIDILNKYQIIDYFRYVDDILIFYNSHISNIDDMLYEFNNIHTNMKFTIEKETNNKINFLDLSIERTSNNLQLGIYRKSTSTDHIIHYDSCHPFEHKKAALNFLFNRLNQYPLSQNNKNIEENIIKTILYNNNYPQHTLQSPKPFINNITQKNKWVTFTYFGHEIRCITKLFKNTDVGISFKTKNNIRHLLKINDNKKDIYNLSGVYKLQCADCPLSYIGQTGRTFNIRYKEHIRDIKNNGLSSKFAQHIIDTLHDYGTINNTLEVLYIGKKGRLLDTYERYYIYDISKNNLQLNDNFTETFNPIYDLLIGIHKT